MADAKLLPLPAIDAIVKYVEDYARACVAHATTAKDAEIEALRAEVRRLNFEVDAAAIYGDDRDAHYLQAETRAERLTEALRPLAELDLTADGFDKRPDDQPVYARNRSVITVGDVRRARALLREQEPAHD